MKLDTEPVLCHSTLIHKPSSKTFEYNDNDMDKAGLMKEHQNVILFDVKGNENDVDSLQSEMNDGDNSSTASEFDCSMGVDNLPNGDKNEIKDFAAPYTPRKLGSFEKDMDSYTDKSIMECELPELVVCYKENSYHDIKDICIDEGVPSWDKILLESGMDECKHSYSCVHQDKDTDHDLMKEEVDNAISIPDDLKSSVENDCDKDSVNQCGFKDLMHVGVANNNAADKNVDDVSEEKFVPENMPSVPELGSEDSLTKISVCDGNGVDQLSFKIASEEAILASPASISAAEESNNSNEEAGQSLASVSVVEESNNSSLTNDFSYNSKVESGSITFDFDSSTPEASSREETSQNSDHGHPETQTLSRLEDLIYDSQRVLSQDQHGHGESSFSMVGPLSGVISYSGPVAYSGSLSLRSDSSTTSTRSFAFPVLQSEWNSSPVRMAKGDRRHFRKHRGWRQGLLCCRF